MGCAPAPVEGDNTVSTDTSVPGVIHHRLPPLNTPTSLLLRARRKLLLVLLSCFACGIPTSPIWGLQGSLTLDRYGNIYLGAGPTPGWSPVGSRSGGSLTFNWLEQSGTPCESRLKSLLTQHGITGSVGYYAGGQVTWSPGNGRAWGFGAFTPQAGGGYTYSWHRDNVGLSW